MAMTERPGGQIRGRESGLRALLLGALALALMACSVPDYVNPVNWFDSKEKKQEIAAAKPAPGKDQPYPKLSSVPDRPDPITIARIRKELTEGLIADSKNARYTDEIIRREPPAPPPRPVQVAKAPASAPVSWLLRQPRRYRPLLHKMCPRLQRSLRPWQRQRLRLPPHRRN